MSILDLLDKADAMDDSVGTPAGLVGFNVENPMTEREAVLEHDQNQQENSDLSINFGEVNSIDQNN